MSDPFTSRPPSFFAEFAAFGWSSLDSCGNRGSVLTEEQRLQQERAMMNSAPPRGGAIPFVYPNEKPCKGRVIEPPQLTDR